MTNDQQAVLNTVLTMTEAFQSNDIDTVLSTYEPGAAISFEPGTPITDKAAIKAMFAGVAGFDPTYTYAGHEVIVSGDLAVHFAPWTMMGQTPDGQAITQSGLSVAVLRKQPDGTWLMVIDNPHGQRLLDIAD